MPQTAPYCIDLEALEQPALVGMETPRPFASLSYEEVMLMKGSKIGFLLLLCVLFMCLVW